MVNKLRTRMSVDDLECLITRKTVTNINNYTTTTKFRTVNLNKTKETAKWQIIIFIGLKYDTKKKQKIKIESQ